MRHAWFVEEKVGGLRGKWEIMSTVYWNRWEARERIKQEKTHGSLGKFRVRKYVPYEPTLYGLKKYMTGQCPTGK